MNICAKIKEVASSIRFASVYYGAADNVIGLARSATE